MGYYDLDTNTSLFIDMSICVSMLRCTHKEWLNLDRIERKKLRTYAAVKSAKAQKRIEELEKENKLHQDIKGERRPQGKGRN